MWIAICEDERTSSRDLEAKIRLWEEASRIRVDIDLFKNASDFLKSGGAFDAAFLDIHLRGSVDGMQLAQQIRMHNDNVILVFVTNFMEYVLRGYEVRALRYLIKPAKQHDVNACMESIAALLRNKEQGSYTWTNEGHEYNVRFDDILYIEAFSHTVTLHTTGKDEYSFYKRISELEDELPDCFVRCHRSFIVNINHVFTIKQTMLELDQSIELPVSQRRRAPTQEAFMQHRVRG